MSRQSKDQVTFGRVWNGYDYNLQVWVKEGVVVPCHHPAKARTASGQHEGFFCCAGYLFGGMSIYGLEGAEDRIEDYGEEG